MSEQLQITFLLILDVVWFIVSLILLIRCIIKKERDQFVTCFMSLLITPVAFIPFLMGLFVLFLMVLFEFIPNLIFKK